MAHYSWTPVLWLLFGSAISNPVSGWLSATQSGDSQWPSMTSSASAGPTSSNWCQGYVEPFAPPYLNDLAQSAGKLYFGSATDQPGTGEDTNLLYQEILNDTHIFGQITPANYMKFFATEPQQDVFNYTGGDIAVAIAQDHDWVVNGTWTAESLTKVMQDHITNLITHWADVCYAWDVINEALSSNGSFSESIWYDVIGPDYFHLAYQFAQEAVESTGRDIKLYYNDYGIESPGNKSTALVALVKDLQSRNIHIDGIGLESHFTVGQTPSYEDQVTTKQAYTALGLEVAITELDVRFEDAATACTNTSGLALQALNYYDSVKSCVDVDGCVGITVWDFDDQYSWIPDTFPGEGAADLYWAGFQRKPAYYACADALQGRNCTVCG